MIDSTERARRVQTIRLKLALLTAVVCVVITGTTVWSTIQLQSNAASFAIAIGAALGLSVHLFLFFEGCLF